MPNSFLNICIIDDDIVDRFHTKIKIEQSALPCTVSCFENVQGLLAMFREDTPVQMDLPDIVLLDTDMAITDGREALDRLRGGAEYGHCPDVYLLSSFYGSGDLGIREHDLVRGCFTKPISAENVARMLLGVSKN